MWVVLVLNLIRKEMTGGDIDGGQKMLSLRGPILKKVTTGGYLI